MNNLTESYKEEIQEIIGEIYGKYIQRKMEDIQRSTNEKIKEEYNVLVTRISSEISNLLSTEISKRINEYLLISRNDYEKSSKDLNQVILKEIENINKNNIDVVNKINTGYTSNLDKLFDDGKSEIANKVVKILNDSKIGIDINNIRKDFNDTNLLLKNSGKRLIRKFFRRSDKIEHMLNSVKLSQLIMVISLIVNIILILLIIYK